MNHIGPSGLRCFFDSQPRPNGRGYYSTALHASIVFWQCHPDLTVGAISSRRFAPGHALALIIAISISRQMESHSAQGSR